MVKGISRQVIVVHPQDAKLFEQAIFILREDALGRDGVSEEALLKEANRLLYSTAAHNGKMRGLLQLVWAAMGAAVVGVLWLVCSIL